MATWAVLQYWSWANKPVRAAAGHWDHHGFNVVAPYRQDQLDRLRREGSACTLGEGFGWVRVRSQLVPDLIAAVKALPDLSRLRVLRCRAEDVEPIPGALVYIDPPYAGTTCAYGHDLSREAVLAMAERWRAAGCTVVVSEAEPLPIPGWYHHELGGPSGFGRTWSKQRAEWLTMSRAAAGQIGLAL